MTVAGGGHEIIMSTNSYFMFYQMICLHTSPLRMVWKCIIGYCPNNFSTEKRKQYLGSKAKKKKSTRYFSAYHGLGGKMNEAYFCLHGVYNLAERQRDKERELTAHELNDITKNCRGTKERVIHIF